ncbi:hypothetical protein TRSC58_06960 [Trypanosoma rangeli SC58]|uniref:Methyltransferase type 11 domain-containing protein n=1 Tax=Trypanosoma rangeli SC58 TaxID=429131 RepID=A0A061IRZ6_TRYRA|nr:hypothetical protein TRSC58_06960 [Trypanosoma rangeli SC58]
MVHLASRGWTVTGIENRARLIRQGVALSEKHRVEGCVLYIHCDLKKTFPTKSEGPGLLHVCRFLYRPLPPPGEAAAASSRRRIPRTQPFLRWLSETEGGRPSSINGFFLRGELRQMLLDSGHAVLIEREMRLPDKRPFALVLARREK